MESYLLDTHTLLWILGNPDKLSEKVYSIKLTPDNTFMVHIVSFWEISIKNSLGKLQLEVSIEELFEKTLLSGIKINSIDITTLSFVNKLTFHHRDPFDRILIAHSLATNIPIISSDEKFDLYSDLKRIW